MSTLEKFALQSGKRLECQRCSEPATKQQPQCLHCAAWLPWGDQAVLHLLEEQRIEANAQLADLQRHWQIARLQADAPGEPQKPFTKPLLATPPAPIAVRTQHTAHPLHWSALALGAVLFFTSGVITARVLVTQPAPAVARVAATGECQDGTYTTSLSSKGACSNHGGIKAWFK